MKAKEILDRAVTHARITTGTIIHTRTGWYTGDGKRCLHALLSTQGIHEARRFVEKNCLPGDSQRLFKIKQRQLGRLALLAKEAIESGKFISAARLCQLAHGRQDEIEELRCGAMRLYALKEESK